MAKTNPDTRLAEADEAFLEKRRSLISFWRYAGPAILAGIVGLAGYLLLRAPLLINPFELFTRLEAGSVEGATLMMLAAMVPVLFGGIFILLVALVLFTYAAAANEKRYLRLLQSRQG